MKAVYFFIIVLCLLSCRPGDHRLSEALQLAGDNREELEKVLEYYSRSETDSLKLRAAEFLISNMPGHYTTEGPILDNLCETFKKDRADLYFSNKYIDVVMPYYLTGTEEGRSEDISAVSSEFLIHHIDAAFEQYDNYPWLEDFPFDMFLEYVLPYRFVTERLDYWRDSLHMSDEQVEIIRYIDNIKYLPAKVSDFSLPQNMRLHDKSFIGNAFGRDIINDCYGLTVRELIKCRAMGIPICIDFMPHYGNRNGPHYWHTYMSPEVKTPESRWLPERKAPKIYRVTYSCNNVYAGKSGEYIPELFQNPFIKDVTDLYASTKDISIRNLRKFGSNPDYAYLCVFNDLAWRPVAISDYDRRSIRFDDVGDDLVYLPVVYREKNMAALNYPFILYRTGKIEHLIPDTTIKQKIVLARKYPSNMTVSGMIKNVDASCWTASNSSDFSMADTMFTYRASGYLLETECRHSDDISAYKFWKFNPARSVLDIAEFMFFDGNGQRVDIKGDKSFESLFDNDPLTNSRLEEKLIMDLGTSAVISKIVCIPRTDGNGIIPGNNYELFYFDLDGWQSLGKKTATDTWLDYDNIPANALLWLHNHTTGKEERIFTYEDGIVRWW